MISGVGQFYIPPLRFGTVNFELYRGAYPTLRNFRFMRRLRLRTIVSLTPEPPNADLAAFADMEKISINHIQALRGIPLNNQFQVRLFKALQFLVDEGNLPVYIHCLDGCRVTGMLVLLLRRLQFWAPQSAFAEYWRYQDAVNIPVADLEKMSGDIDKFLQELTEELIIPENIPKWLWGGQRNTLVPGLRLLHIPAIDLGGKADGSDLRLLPVPTPRVVSDTSKMKYESVARVETPTEETIAVQTASKDVTGDMRTREKAPELLPAKLSRSLDALSLHGLDAPTASSSAKASLKLLARKQIQFVGKP